MAKVKVEFTHEIKSFLTDPAITAGMERIANQIMSEFGATSIGYDVIPSEDRKTRSTMNMVAKGDTGWKEQTQGGPITNVAAARRRITGRVKAI